MTLVASMIVRNELGRYLELAVDHLLGFCDEIRVLDDGSDDGTYEWLIAQPGVSVLTASTRFFDHEGKARNELLAWTLDASPTYVLAIDADEFVSDPDAVLAAVAEGGRVYTLTIEEVWNLDRRGIERRIDGHWGPRTVPMLYRGPRGRANQNWRVLDRALACGREPVAVRMMAGRAKPSGSAALHFGWARESERAERAERYFEHDGGRYHASRHLQSILWPSSRIKLARFAWPPGLEYLRDELLLAAAR